MKKLFYLFALVCVCLWFTSCEDDDAVKLTINTSAYDVVKDLKDADGNLYFTGKLEDDLQIRISFLVRKHVSNSFEIVAQGIRYINDIKSIASYTTQELEPGVYDVIIVSDFIKGEKEFNTVTANEQYKGLNVVCKESAGVYNAFGTAYLADITVEKKTDVTLNTIKKGSLVTLLFKNTDQMKSASYKMSLEKFVYVALGSFGNEFNKKTGAFEHPLTKSIISAQHYCASMKAQNSTDLLTVSWISGAFADGYYSVELSNNEDKVIELDFATNQGILK
jgi:lipoprotein